MGDKGGFFVSAPARDAPLPQRPFACTTPMPMATTNMTQPRIIIVGGGFGGAYCAQTLETRLPRNSAEIILLDRNNYFAFYPLLMEAGTGSLEPRHAVVPIRSFLKQADFRMGEVEAIDFDRRIVHYHLTGSDRCG